MEKGLKPRFPGMYVGMHPLYITGKLSTIAGYNLLLDPCSLQNDMAVIFLFHLEDKNSFGVNIST